jgi:hypothetical protein
MQQQTLLNEVRDLLSLFVTRVKAAAALGHTDINVISESVLLDLFRIVFSLPGLRNVNHERKNFPGIDLADETTGIAFQVTATPDLSKVKETLQIVLQDGLQRKYPRVRIYVITEKQASYSQSSIDAVTHGRMNFDASTDVLDYRDVLRMCGTLPLASLARVVEILRAQFPQASLDSQSKRVGLYLPAGTESVELNLVPIWFPDTLYVADFVEPTAAATVPASRTSRRRRNRKPANPRAAVAKDILRRDFEVPEDFEINSNRLISFHDPTASGSPLVPYVDAGTLTPIRPREYYAYDEDQLRVFKSLLRRAFQRQVRPERVAWQFERHLFFYAPLQGSDERVIAWQDEKTASRTVFKRTMKNNKPDEVLTCKHLAFYVDFPLIENVWYMAITPTWYFTCDGYRPDPFGAKRISWLKGQENDQQVHTHFRFICHRIRAIQERSLFDGVEHANVIQIGDAQAFPNHPVLPDELWKPPSLHREGKAGDPEQVALLS